MSVEPSKKTVPVIVLDFTALPFRPKPFDIERFVHRELEAKSADLCALQISVTPALVYIECANRDVAVNFSSKNLQKVIKHDNKQYPIPVYIKDDTVEVRISDLPLEVENDAIAKAMSQYGNVLTIANERWRKFFTGIRNGVRIVKIKLDRQIPKRLQINGCFSTITYTGQPKTKSRLKQNQTSGKNGTDKINPSTRNNEKSAAAANNNNKNNDVKPSINQEEATSEMDLDFSSSSSSSSSNNRNINDSNNNNNNEQPSSATIQHMDDEGFETVLSKSQRKVFKRQHSLETTEQQQQQLQEICDLYDEVHKKERYYFGKWMKMRREISEEKDPEKINQLKIMLEELDQKHEKYLKMMHDIAKKSDM